MSMRRWGAMESIWFSARDYQMGIIEMHNVAHGRNEIVESAMVNMQYVKPQVPISGNSNRHIA